MKDLTFSQIKKLCKAFDLKPSEIDFNDYHILTDDEANDMVAEQIKESLWAFTPTFLADVTGVDGAVFTAIQSNGRCEDNNNAILSIIEKTTDLESVVEEAIRWDGRGHFLSSYDGNEHELGGDLYAYRIN